MQELIDQLLRLYLPLGTSAPEGLSQHLAGDATQAFPLVKDGATRALVMAFDQHSGVTDDAHWQGLCALATALQGELGLPAPAVSISGATGYRLWLSFEQPIPIPMAQNLSDWLYAAYCPDMADRLGAAGDPVHIPRCRHPATGLWAAFIHPGMGAAFTDEAGLEMPPPAAAQAAFLESLHSISPVQLEHAIARLRPAALTPEPEVVATNAVAPQGLLLKDATLDDIVRLLHSRNIEPTFRHVLPSR